MHRIELQMDPGWGWQVTKWPFFALTSSPRLMGSLYPADGINRVERKYWSDEQDLDVAIPRVVIPSVLREINPPMRPNNPLGSRYEDSDQSE